MVTRDFKIRKVNHVAVRGLKRLPELSVFQDRESFQQHGCSKSKKMALAHFKIRQVFNNVAIRSLKRLPELSAFWGQESLQQRGCSKSKRLPELSAFQDKEVLLKIRIWKIWIYIEENSHELLIKLQVIESQAEQQLLHDFEHNEITGHGKVPDSACFFFFFLFSLSEYIQIHYIYYHIQLQTFGQFSCPLANKNGEMTTDECAILLKMEMVDFSFFLRRFHH